MTTVYKAGDEVKVILHGGPYPGTVDGVVEEIVEGKYWVRLVNGNAKLVSKGSLI